MRPLVLAAALIFLGSCGRDETPRRLLIVGWDGASFRMVDPLLAQGRLPNLARLIERGSTARLESTIIPISSAAWTSAVTGKGPGETGVYSFFEPIEDSYDVRLVSSRSNRASPIWRILTRRGQRSIVFGVPMTYPPEPILGLMVAGMLSPFRATYAHPPELTDELRERGFEPDLDVWLEARQVGWSDLDRQLTIKEEVLRELLTEEDWRFGMVVFKSLDVVSHRTLEADFAEVVGPVYERLDAILGELLAAAGPETDVLVVSDHGFHVYERGMNLHAWLFELGFATRKERVKRFRIDEGDPFRDREHQIIRQLHNEIDWPRTRAFAVKCEGNFGSLRLNLAGREPQGSVPPEEAEALLDEIEAALLELRPDPARPAIVRRVLRGDRLYPGPHRGVVPDLLFEVDPDCQVFADAEEPGTYGEYPVVIPDHDLHGILVAAGPSFRRVSERGLAHITDLAPTALHVLGEPVYEEMQGVVRGELLRDPEPPRTLREAEDPSVLASPGGVGAPFTAAELEELERRLGALGYGE